MDLERAISRVLGTGILVSSACVVVGGGLFLAWHGDERVVMAPFVPAHESLRGLGDIAHAAARLDAAAWMQLGVVLLLLTPMARVVMMLIHFTRKRDGLFIVMCLFVLGALIFGIAG